MKEDTPIELASLSQLSIDDIDAMLLKIRERRLRPVREYNEMLALKNESRVENLEAQYDRHISMFAKELAQFDKVVAKLDSRAVNLRALKMEMGV